MIELAGIPLVGRAARSACAAAAKLPGPGHRILCSTDDPSIGEAARAWGAEVPFLRPEALASDTADAVDVALHAIDFLGSRGERFAALALVQPTSPLLEAQDLLEAIRLFFENERTSVASVSPVHPPQWTFGIHQSRLQGVLPALPLGARRQQLETYCGLNGAVFVVGPEELRRTRRFVEPDHTIASLMPAERGIDIDNLSDLKLAEALVWRAGSSLGAEAGGASAGAVRSIPLKDRRLGPGSRCFIVAEAGVNHNGDLEMARRLVDAAASAGADAVKFQTFRSDALVARSALKAPYQERTTGAGSQLDMIRALELPYDGFREIQTRCVERGILFLSTPYDLESARFLVSLDVPLLKVPSGEVTNLPFLAKLSGLGKPMVLSTGMSTLVEVEAAVRTIAANGNPPLVLLQCVSNYPADPEDANLLAMHTLASAFHLPVGYSDHTPGIEVAVAAAALGACFIEKHLTLDRTLPGPDHAASLDPAEFSALCRGIRTVEAARGTGRKAPAASEAAVAAAARRSLVAARDLAAGTVLTRDLIAIKRPGVGLPPSMLEHLIGRVIRTSLVEDTLFSLDMLS